MKTVAELKNEMNRLTAQRDDLMNSAERLRHQMAEVCTCIHNINTAVERATQLINYLENNPEETST